MPSQLPAPIPVDASADDVRNARKHRVLVVGVGSIGERHLRCFQATGRTAVGFVETRTELRDSITARYRAVGWESLDAALSQPFEAAVICTPAPLHVPQALQCARAGLHVLIEKPVSVSFDGLADLEAALQARNLLAGVAYVYRSHPLFERLKAKLESGEFGRPRELVCVSGQHFPTYRPAYRTIYYTDRKTGGGAIQDALTHLVNAGEWLLGPVTRLIADAAHLVLPDVTVEDTVHLIARHGTVMASYALNQFQAPNELQFTVNCDGGSLRISFPENQISWLSKPGDAWTSEDLGPLERDAIFIAQANRFLDALESRSTFPCSLADGVQTLRCNLTALESLEQNCWIELPERGL